MFDLSGKVAFITGASSGIGKASAVALANQGAKVALAARRIDRLTSLAQELKTNGREALPIEMDVTKKEDIEKAILTTVSTFGKIDILLNNAGIAEFVPFLEMSEEQWDKTMDTNLKGYFLVAQAATKEMVKNPEADKGRIINISSIASGGVGVGFPSIAHYCASKGGVVALTEALACEFASHGILVNAIAPGVIETEMTEGMLKDASQANALLGRAPLKRAGRPEEIAAGVVFLASKEASYITGTTLYIDGGWLAT